MWIRLLDLHKKVFQIPIHNENYSITVINFSDVFSEPKIIDSLVKTGKTRDHIINSLTKVSTLKHFNTFSEYIKPFVKHLTWKVSFHGFNIESLQSVLDACPNTEVLDLSFSNILDIESQKFDSNTKSNIKELDLYNINDGYLDNIGIFKMIMEKLSSTSIVNSLERLRYKFTDIKISKVRKHLTDFGYSNNLIFIGYDDVLAGEF
jgi:hypothetical protein